MPTGLAIAAGAVAAVIAALVTAAVPVSAGAARLGLLAAFLGVRGNGLRTSTDRLRIEGRSVMPDVAYVLLTVVLFGLLALTVRAVEKL